MHYLEIIMINTYPILQLLNKAPANFMHLRVKINSGTCQKVAILNLKTALKNQFKRFLCIVLPSADTFRSSPVCLRFNHKSCTCIKIVVLGDNDIKVKNTFNSLILYNSVCIW